MKNKIIYVRITASRKKRISKNPENQKTLGKEFRGITIPSCTFLLMVKLLAFLDLILEKLMKKTKILNALRIKIFFSLFSALYPLYSNTMPTLCSSIPVRIDSPCVHLLFEKWLENGNHFSKLVEHTKNCFEQILSADYSRVFLLRQLWIVSSTSKVRQIISIIKT